jgi:hypothetical protein
MSDLSSFMHDKRAELLAGDYVDSESNRLSCWKTASQIAKLMRDNGKEPVVVEMADVVEGTIQPLCPLLYEGRVTFGGHVAVMVDGLIYDPLLEEPEPVATYAQKAFGKDLDLRDVPDDVWLHIQ